MKGEAVQQVEGGHTNADTQSYSEGNYEIPPEFLRGTKGDKTSSDDSDGDQQPSASGKDEWGCPIIMFINSSSGGHVGPQLAKSFSQVCGSDQVFDLSKDKPDKVLSRLFANLADATKAGDPRAKRVREQLRVLACGGDGTVAWILTTIWHLKLHPPPPVAVIPLGTGNGLSINFGWGKTMRPQWLQSTHSMAQELQALVEAKVRDIDLWNIKFSSPTVKFDEDEKPHGLFISAAAAPGKDEDLEGASDKAGQDQPTSSMQGMFVYYFSFGLDAEVAYRFHELRKTHPKLASKRKVNELLYAGMGVRTGWFCGAHALCESIAAIKVRKNGGGWQKLNLSPRIYAIVIVNLQTYSGGRDIWGLHDHDGEARRPEETEKGFHKPIFDDGLIEIVGLKSGWHTLAVLSGLNKRVHGERCGQGHEVIVDFHAPPKRGMAAFMRLDGEPWMQDLTGATPNQPLRAHIRHAGRGSMLLNTEKLLGTTVTALRLAEREQKYSSPDPTTRQMQEA